MRKRTAVAIVMVVCIGLIISLYVLRRHLPYSVGGRPSVNPEILLHLEEIEIIGRSNGEKVWSVTAESADLTQGNTSVTFNKIKNGVIYDQGKPALKLSAGRAVFRSAFGDVDVSGGLKVSSVKGFTVQTEVARWSGYFKRLSCPKKVKFTFGDSRLEGSNLTADVRNNEITMDDGVLIIALDSADAQSGRPALPPAIP